MISWFQSKREWLLIAAALFFLGLAWWLEAVPRVRYRALEPVAGVSEAGFYYFSPVRHPAAVVMLSNRYNNTSPSWIDDPAWREFARDHRCALVELALVSPEEQLSDGTGYYYAARGSGQMFLSGLDRLWPERPPLLLYGFSGGAHFASRFVAWAPERVKGWVAYAAGWWDEPQPTAAGTPDPPGVIVCGELDSRRDATAGFFRAGRAVGKPWLWIGIAENDHDADPRVGAWVRRYFAGILAGAAGKWVDVPKDAEHSAPPLQGWLAVKDMEPEWRTLCTAVPDDNNATEMEEETDEETE